MTVRGLLASIDSRELTEWAMFFKLERDAREEAKAEPKESIERKMIALARPSKKGKR